MLVRTDRTTKTAIVVGCKMGVADNISERCGPTPAPPASTTTWIHSPLCTSVMTRYLDIGTLSITATLVVPDDLHHSKLNL